MEINETVEGLPAKKGLKEKLRAAGTRLAERANVTESRFLALLRYSALAGAAIALVVSGVMLALGVARQVGPTEVEPEAVSIATEDVIPLRLRQEQQEEPKSVKITVSKAIRDKTAAVYKSYFAQFERPGTKITQEQVVDFVWTEDRINRFNSLVSAGLKDEAGKQIDGRDALMAHALETVSKATKSKDYASQLVAYRDAKQANVCTTQTRTRERVVEAWDRYGTYCDGWYVSPIGCPTTRVVSEPYEEKVCEMKFPEDLSAPADLFESSVERYAETAQMDIEAARIEAEERTASNHARKLEGQENIGMSGQLFLGFLAVMFLYLFIAMERHNRNLRALMERPRE